MPNTDKNHSTHIEDSVLQGPKKIQMAILFFEGLLNNSSSLTKSLKIDGAPVVLAGSNAVGITRPFVAAKSFLNNGKVATNEDEIQELFGDRPGLASKMKKLLELLPELQIPEGEIWRGDLLFSKDTLQNEGGNNYFHPNTLVYAPNSQSEIDAVNQADIGIIWHTYYTGETLTSLTAHADLDVYRLKPSTSVFTLSPLFKQEELSIEETFLIKSTLATVKERFRGLMAGSVGATYAEVLKNKVFLEHLTTYLNHLIRQGKGIYQFSPTDLAYSWIPQRYEQKIEGLKTEKFKTKWKNERDSYIDAARFIEPVLGQMISLMKALVHVKALFIQNFNSLKDLPFMTFYKKKIDDRAVLVKTAHEGFVITDKKGNSFKLVDREEFTKINFGVDTVRGWKEESKQVQ